MDDLRLETHYKPHIRDQIATGALVLFTGAGFSLEAFNVRGGNLPSVNQLSRELWNLAWASSDFEADTQLQDVFEYARMNFPKQTRELLHNLFTVDQTKIPEWYLEILDFPWLRAYTLNIDDLMEKAVERYNKRTPSTISALTNSVLEINKGSFDIVHLNGVLADAPDDITFSRPQYALRTGKDPYYDQLKADLLARPVVFIGSSLEEGPMWEHLVSRETRGSRVAKELRPRSYLVIPHINSSKAAILEKNFNIVWIPMTGEEFYQQVLQDMKPSKAAGVESLKVRSKGENSKELSFVSDLVQTNGHSESEYLLGQEPSWQDCKDGKVAIRDCFAALNDKVSALRADHSPDEMIVLTGTAGSGKSSALYWLGTQLLTEGVDAIWIDASERSQTRDLVRSAEKLPNLEVVLIDNADVFGFELSRMIRRLRELHKRAVVVAEMRSTKIDSCINRVELGTELAIYEHAIPNLCDEDIEAILDVMDRNSRLGNLKGLDKNQRIDRFKRFAGRQLLVAMYEATSGKKFEERITSELEELSQQAQMPYALISTATAYRYDLSFDEVILACPNQNNDTLNEINSLVRRKLAHESKGGFLRARHRVIADMVYNQLLRTGTFEEVLRGLLLIGAAKVTSNTPRNNREARMYRQFVNHHFICRAIERESARVLYSEFEDAFSWDSHYWLHRGALELQCDNLDVAENFLNQALSLRPDDYLILTEWSYLQFKKALKDPLTSSAPELVEDAFTSLEEIFLRYPDRSSHAYHILGQQGLNWAEVSNLSFDAKHDFLKRIEEHIKQAVLYHPDEKMLATLDRDVRAAILRLAVND